MNSTEKLGIAIMIMCAGYLPQGGLVSLVAWLFFVFGFIVCDIGGKHE